MLATKHLLLLAATIFVASSTIIVTRVVAEPNKDINRKSIVFDIKTPEVFYCPQEKPFHLDKMIVKAKPLDKLCEFGGKTKPKDSPSDCYNDVDESEFACTEKKRFLKRVDLSKSESNQPINGSGSLDDLEYILSKNSNKRKIIYGKS